jgi:hypothetical protein
MSPQMPWGNLSIKRSVVVMALLAATVCSSVWSTSADASAQRGASRVLVSNQTEEEAAGFGEEAQGQEGEAEEGSEEAEAENASEAATHRPRKHPSACVVPSVRGNTLRGARRALLAAHCSLGKVYGPRSGHGTPVVQWQSATSGSRLRSGSSVSLRLALRTRHR